ncbi:MAG TPA: hypothetical protein VN317_06805, partial [Candidatus Methanoperedens sp.]|nr:hypothetical protein [Candidatus Methanoperedens sp.]
PFGQIQWYGTLNPTGWPIVGKLDTLTVDATTKWGSTMAPTICWSWTVPAWPAVSKGVIGSQWVIAKIGGQWVATPWEYVTAAASICRKTEAGNPDKGGHPGDPPFIQGQAGPITSWTPHPGEEVGFMNSTIARGPAPATPHERTAIKKIIWP